MSLLEMQRVLTKVLTSDEFRQIFVSDPEQACRAYSLTNREMASLRALDIERMNSYAIILRDGRIGLALKAFPVTQSLIPHDFHKFSARYACDYPPITLPGSAMFNEAMMLYHFILDLINEGTLNRRYLSDVLEYEKDLFSVGSRLDASLSASAFARANAQLPKDFSEDVVKHLKPVRGEHVEASSFAYNITELMPHLSRREEPDFPEERTHLLFHKAPGEQGVKISKINAATKEFIDMCDGERTTADIISRIAAAREIVSTEGKAEVARRCHKMFQMFVKLNVISFVK